MTEPRAYTEDEIVGLLIGNIRATVRYWATLPDTDKATGRLLTVEGRCEGVAFSILSLLDGASLNMPAFDLIARPHPDDRQTHEAEGENWFEPGSVVSVSLHDHFFHRPTTKETT
jgi:hypothetical protein